MALAGVVIISWVVNWIFWKKKICCCKECHNPTIIGIYWWSAFIFLCGIIACCISGFVISSKFGKIVRAVQCSYERIYYDSEFGQIKDSSPKWEGLELNSKKLENSQNLLNDLQEKNDEEINSYLLPNDYWVMDSSITIDGTNILFKGKNHNDYLNAIKEFLQKLYDLTSSGIKLKDNSDIFFDRENPTDTSTIVGNFIDLTNKIIEKYKIFEDFLLKFHQIENVNKIEKIKDNANFFLNISEDLKSYKNGYLDDVEYYVKVGKGCGYILVIIYLSILGFISIIGCVVLMAYINLKKQFNFDIIMHIIWNSIKFFSFSFFMFGAAYGMLFLGLRDIISYNMYIFGNENLDINSTTYVLPKKEAKNFINYCLTEEKADYSAQFDSFLLNDINDFFNNFDDLETLFQRYNATLNTKFKDSYWVYKDNRLIRNLDIDDSTNIIPDNTGSPVPSVITSEIKLPKLEQSNMVNNLKSSLDKIVNELDISNLAYEKGNFMDSFDCGFLKNDLAMVYNSLYDLSIESRILCALSCCIAFFGEFSVYFYLLSMYHYDKNEFKEGNLDFYESNRKNLDDDISSKNIFMEKFNSRNLKKNNKKLDYEMKNKK